MKMPFTNVAAKAILFLHRLLICFQCVEALLEPLNLHPVESKTIMDKFAAVGILQVNTRATIVWCYFLSYCHLKVLVLNGNCVYNVWHMPMLDSNLRWPYWHACIGPTFEVHQSSDVGCRRLRGGMGPADQVQLHTPMVNVLMCTHRTDMKHMRQYGVAHLRFLCSLWNLLRWLGSLVSFS